MTEKIYEIIRQKHEEFLEFERHTEKMLCCDIDEIEGYMQKRQQCMDNITEMDERLTELAADTASPQLATAALKLKCNRDELPQELVPIFDSTLEVFAVVNRIIEMDKQVNQRMESEKARLLEKIKTNNQSVGAQASKYYPTNTFGQSGIILNEKL